MTLSNGQAMVGAHIMPGGRPAVAGRLARLIAEAEASGFQLDG